MTIAEQLHSTVTLDELLQAKDRRAARQNTWLQSYQQPLISLTLVTPGPVKDSALYRRSMRAAVEACNGLLSTHGWNTLAHQVFWFDTGPEALWSVDHAGAELKAATVALEQSHRIGRLWDIDVISPGDGIIGRDSLGRAGRHCLLCDQPAHACSRSRRHPLEQVVEKIEDMLDAYFCAK
ncbi:citrate lyase holo-[acyl-carrier protein] synthase [Acerihabitans sp. TG2]|uniref:citrate lyase holo-[acyl-carrier protein] synthase n=1 Tax=Acerihabitans sp. TG2 TaxID=3096008 RepID=UPI002B231CC3|nr:citrate lyase holo-[acyl-carrier protein] synthase [Acerihabitans sp. TG2]MEA9391922.1 citrate lyase holo-[acyl-carrier protein] synthase [Acerihabitans sp. TG2]